MSDDKKARALGHSAAPVLLLVYVAVASCCVGVLAWRFLAVPFLDALDAGAPWATAVVGIFLLGALALALRKAVGY